jgi:signal transduction histidine kinase
MENLIKADPAAAIQALAASKSEIRKSLSELRVLLFDLQRDSSADSRSDEPLTKYVNDVVKRWRLPARVTVTGDLREVPKPLLGAAYVVIREGLANAAKHAGASRVSVWVNAVPDELTVEVADTGRGFAANATPNEGPGHHFGLGMMNRRVTEAGGTLDVQSAPGKGTKVVARLPVRGS